MIYAPPCLLDVLTSKSGFIAARVSPHDHVKENLATTKKPAANITDPLFQLINFTTFLS